MLTLSEAQTELAEYATASKLVSRINAGAHRLMDSGRWDGMTTRAALHVQSNGVLALPPYFGTVLAVKVDGATRQLANRWFEFLPNTSDIGRSGLANVEDLGTGYPTLQDLTEDCYIYAECAGNTGTLHIRGVDGDGRPIFTAGSAGVSMVLNDPATVTVWSRVDQVTLSGTRTAPVYLYAQSVADETADPVLIGYYLPGEKTPDYRRYLVRELADTETDIETVTAMVTRKFVPAVASTDLVIPGNTGALGNAMLAIHFELEGDLGRARAHMNTAISTLNSEQRLKRAPGEAGGVRVHHIGEAPGAFSAIV